MHALARRGRARPHFINSGVGMRLTVEIWAVDLIQQQVELRGLRLHHGVQRHTHCGGGPRVLNSLLSSSLLCFCLSFFSVSFFFSSLQRNSVVFLLGHVGRPPSMLDAKWRSTESSSSSSLPAAAAVAVVVVAAVVVVVAAAAAATAAAAMDSSLLSFGHPMYVVY